MSLALGPVVELGNNCFSVASSVNQGSVLTKVLSNSFNDVCVVALILKVGKLANAPIPAADLRKWRRFC